MVATPLATPDMDAGLAHLPSEDRFGYAHLATPSGLRSGASLVVPLVGFTLGPTWERVVHQMPPVERALRRAYVRLWSYRRSHGCGARGTR